MYSSIYADFESSVKEQKTRQQVVRQKYVHNENVKYKDDVQDIVDYLLDLANPLVPNYNYRRSDINLSLKKLNFDYEGGGLTSWTARQSFYESEGSLYPSNIGRKH